MGVILNPSFETDTVWARGEINNGFDVPVYTTDWFHAGSRSMRFEMNCQDVSVWACAYIEQSITVQTTHKISYRVLTVDKHIDSFHDVYFRVLFDGNQVQRWSDPPHNFDASIYRCYDGAGWQQHNCGAHAWHQNIDLSAYAGQTGNIRFEFYRLDPQGYTLDHLYESYIYLDDITESYTALSDYYVKVGGDDTLAGTSWATAWATINKGATTVTDGKTLHVGFGNYVLEPDSNKIAPQNIGASGIEYIFETAGSSGGTGTVSIEKN